MTIPKNIIEDTWSLIKRQGLPFLLVSLGLLFLYVKVEKTEQKADMCNNELLKMLREDRATLIILVQEVKAIQSDNRALLTGILNEVKKED